jgi:3-methyladenine DNA glycosylase AlkD
MRANDILQELEALGNEQYKKIYERHGAREPFFGVSVEALKKIVKREKKNYALALDLYATGNYDAMYLAGLLSDEQKMTADDLRRWVDQANWHAVSEYIVAGIAAETPHGWPLALEWIDSDRELVATAGWATLANIVSIVPDAELDLETLRALLDRVGATLQQSPNRVRYAMNGFVIAVGSYVPELTEHAITTACIVGKVSCEMGQTSCKVPPAVDYIEKVRAAGKLGKKRKMARC